MSITKFTKLNEGNGMCEKRNSCLNCARRRAIMEKVFFEYDDKCTAIPKREIFDRFKGTKYEYHLCRNVRHTADYCMYYKPKLWERIRKFFSGK